MSQGTDKTPWKVQGKWSVCPYVFEPEVQASWKIPPKITVHDVTSGMENKHRASSFGKTKN